MPVRCACIAVIDRKRIGGCAVHEKPGVHLPGGKDDWNGDARPDRIAEQAIREDHLVTAMQISGHHFEWNCQIAEPSIAIYLFQVSIEDRVVGEAAAVVEP